MKKIKLIILVVFLLISGCTKEEVVEEHKEPIVKEEVKDTYIDNNPIKLGIFLSNNNYYNKEVIEDTYYTSLTNGVDIGSFEVFLTQKFTERENWLFYGISFQLWVKSKISYFIVS